MSSLARDWRMPTLAPVEFGDLLKKAAGRAEEATARPLASPAQLAVNYENDPATTRISLLVRAR